MGWLALCETESGSGMWVGIVEGIRDSLDFSILKGAVGDNLGFNIFFFTSLILGLREYFGSLWKVFLCLLSLQLVKGD